MGFLERPERVVLIIIGALADRMAPVLWLIAVLSNITVIHRIYFTRQEARKLAQAADRILIPAGSNGDRLSIRCPSPQHG